MKKGVGLFLAFPVVLFAGCQRTNDWWSDIENIPYQRAADALDKKEQTARRQAAQALNNVSEWSCDQLYSKSKEAKAKSADEPLEVGLLWGAKAEILEAEIKRRTECKQK